MATIQIDLRPFYVYALLRGDCTPFYVGMGVGNRWLEHEKFSSLKNTHKNNIIRKMVRDGWPDIPKMKLAVGLTRGEAAQLERDLISLLGRHPNGPLTNKTGGGEGLWKPDAETRAKMAKARERFMFTPEIRAKISAAGLGRKSGPHSADRKEKNRQAHLGMKHTEETRDKMSRTRKGRLVYAHQADVLNKIRPPFTAEVKARLDRTGTTQTADAKRRTGDAAKARWATPEFRERVRAAKAAAEARKATKRLK